MSLCPKQSDERKIYIKKLWRGKQEIETYTALYSQLIIYIFILRSNIFKLRKDITCFMFFKFVVPGPEWK